MASELLAWMAMLALDGKARLPDPKRLRLHLFSAAGRRARGVRCLRLRIAARCPWNPVITSTADRLLELAPG